MPNDQQRIEVTTDPEAIGYATMSDEEVSDSMNAKTRSRNRNAMTGTELLNLFDSAEFSGLSPEQDELVWAIIHMVNLNPHGVEYDIISTAFGPTSETIKSIDAARIEMISRAVEIGSNPVTSGSVARVRFDPIKEAEKEAATNARDLLLIAARGV